MNKLPPLPDESLDGYKEEAAIPGDKPLPKTCTHKQVQLLSSHEIKCPCGAGWSGFGIQSLYNVLRSQ